MARTYGITKFARNGQEASIEFDEDRGRAGRGSDPLPVVKTDTVERLREWVNLLELDAEVMYQLLVKALLARGVAFTNANRPVIEGRKIVVDLENAQGNIVRLV